VVYLHLYARADTGEVGPVARWEGQGPVTSQYVRDLLGPHARFVIKPVIDLAGMAPVDGYEIPDRLREAVHLRTPADIYPWAANTRRGQQQVDHTKPYQHAPPDRHAPPGQHGPPDQHAPPGQRPPPGQHAPPGQTGLHNLGLMTRRHHRFKTFGPVQVKQPFPGIYLWQDQYGHTTLVDHTGTRRLGRTDPTVDLPDLALEIYDADPEGIEITYDRQHTP
jgi:hypothetical protein